MFRKIAKPNFKILERVSLTLFFCLLTSLAFAANSPPQVGTITPSSGSSRADQTIAFTTTYTDPDGWQNIRFAYLLINTAATNNNCFLGLYSPDSNKFYLRNDANTTWIGGFTVGSANSIENSYVKLDCLSSSASGSVTTLTVRWAITFKSTFIGTKNTYLRAIDYSRADSNWIQRGTWTISTADTIPPTGTIKINNDDLYCRTPTVTLYLSASDDKSGIDKMCFSNNGIDWTTPQSYYSYIKWKLTPGDGKKIVYVKFCDKAGNWSNPYSDKIILDTQPPYFKLNPVIKLKNSKIQVLAGDKEYYASILINGKEVIPANKYNTWYYEYPLLSPESQISVTASDRAENIAPKTLLDLNKDAVNLNTGPPVITGLRIDPQTKDLILTIKDPPSVLSYNIYYANSLTSSGQTEPFRLAQADYPVSGKGTTEWRDNGTYTQVHPSDPQVRMRFYKLEIAKVTYDTRDEFVQTLSNRLVLKNSQKPYYFSSTNQYYLFYKPLDMVDEVFDDAKAMGINVIRTWGFCDGMYEEDVSFQPEAGVYSETGFARMDYLIKKAKDLNMRLIITLVNYWDDFGGMGAYVRWSSTATKHDDFYTDPYCKKLYKDYVEYFLNRQNTLTGIRYKDDPTILIWELANEPRCYSDSSGDTLYSWVNEMAGFIKSIDQNHLVATGGEGWYKKDGYCSYGEDYLRNCQSPNIDICSFHLYFGLMDNSETQALQWIKEHIDDAHFKIGKPVYCGEMGFPVSRGASGAAEQMARRNQLYADWYTKFLERVIDGAGFWLLSADSYYDYDGYTVYYPQDSETCSIINNFSTKMAELRELNYFPPIILLEDKEVPEDELWEFQIPVSNPSNLSLSFSGYNLPAGATLDSNGYFRWPSPPAGVYKDIEVQVSYGTSVYSGKFNIKVKDTNWDNTPRIANIIPSIVIDKNTSLDNAVDLWALTTDDETPVDKLIFTVTCDSPKVGISLDNNRYIDISPAKDYAGSGSLTITVTDQRGLTDTRDVDWAVLNKGVIKVPQDYPTIKAAMAAALEGDTIYVGPGTYAEPNGPYNYFRIKNEVSLISTAGAKNTIIKTALVLSQSCSNITTTIQGFTITNVDGHGIGSTVVSGSPTIKNNIIKGNKSFGIFLTYSSAKIYNNIVEGNGEGGIRCEGEDYQNGALEIINNVVVNNRGNWYGGGISIAYSKGKVFSNIVANNYAPRYDGGISSGSNYFGFEIGYNDVWNNTNGAGQEEEHRGEGTISVDPKFIGSDYHLDASSPCRNSGHPDRKYNDRDGSRNDMGIYGGPSPF